MTTQDYRRIVSAANRARDAVDFDFDGPIFADGWDQAIDAFCKSIATELGDDNDRFDRELFLAECGVDVANR